MKTARFSPKLRWLAAGVAILAAAAPVVAQNDDDNITITGRYGRVPDNVQSLSLRVNYSDLDLSTAFGRHQLSNRIDDTANFLCDKLGESDDNLGAIPSCQTAAYEDGMQQVAWVERGYEPRGDGWATPAAYHPRYYQGRYRACTAYRHDDCVEYHH
jgi:UrcA family protein